MKLQFNILIKTFLKSWIWFVLLIVASVFTIMGLIGANGADIPREVFESMVLNSYKSSSFLLGSDSFISISSVFQLLMNIIFVYDFYTFELNRSFTNNILRLNDKRWLIEKILVIIVYNIIFRIIINGFNYYIFNMVLKINTIYILKPIIIGIFFSVVLITAINLFKKNSIGIFLVPMISSLIFLAPINYKELISLIIFFIGLNLLIFNFQMYYSKETK